MGEFRSGKSYQKFIHFPKTGILSTKDNLCRLIKKMKVCLDDEVQHIFSVEYFW